jgi:hypothetical protein
VSLPVTHSYVWGKDIVILVEQMKYPGNPPSEVDPFNKVVWVLVSDRDEFPALGETIVWQIVGNNGIISQSSELIQGWVDWGRDEGVVNGWVVTDSLVATTETVNPNQAMPVDGIGNPVIPCLHNITIAEHLESLFGADYPSHPYAVSAVIINSGEDTTVDLKLLLDESMRANAEPGEGVIERHARSANMTLSLLDFSLDNEDPVDPIETLTAGWNMISFKSSNQNVADAIESIEDSVVSVWAFDNQAKKWLGYDPSIGYPASLWVNDLKSMDTANPYWIEVSQTVTWVY